MKSTRWQQWVLLLSLLITASSAIAVDPKAEQALDEALGTQLRQGDLIWLDVQGRRVGAIHTPVMGPVTQKGAVILLHDQGRNPDWPQLMRPLRIGLARVGWETLAVQMPMTPVDAALPLWAGDRAEARARIAAAVAWFKAKNILNITLLGHGLGAAFALDYMLTVPAPAAKPTISAVALVGIVLPAPYAPDLLAGLETLEVPILDLYGSDDYAAVMEQADRRLSSARRAENSHYEQFRFPQARHDFNGLEMPLLQRLRGWFDRVAPAIEIAVGKDAVPTQTP